MYSQLRKRFSHSVPRLLKVILIQFLFVSALISSSDTSQMPSVASWSHSTSHLQAFFLPPASFPQVCDRQLQHMPGVQGQLTDKVHGLLGRLMSMNQNLVIRGISWILYSSFPNLLHVSFFILKFCGDLNITSDLWVSSFLCLVFSQVLSESHVEEIGTGILWPAETTIYSYIKMPWHCTLTSNIQLKIRTGRSIAILH